MKTYILTEEDVYALVNKQKDLVVRHLDRKRGSSVAMYPLIEAISQSIPFQIKKMSEKNENLLTK